jgi:hypothetical protein
MSAIAVAAKSSMPSTDSAPPATRSPSPRSPAQPASLN